MVDYSREGVSLTTRQAPGRVVSELLIQHAQPRDAGKYSCRPQPGGPAHVLLHVLMHGG